MTVTGGECVKERIAVEILREENVRAAGSFRHFLRKCHLPLGGRLIRTAYLHGMSNKCRLSVFLRIVPIYGGRRGFPENEPASFRGSEAPALRQRYPSPRAYFVILRSFGRRIFESNHIRKSKRFLTAFLQEFPSAVAKKPPKDNRSFGGFFTFYLPKASRTAL